MDAAHQHDQTARQTLLITYATRGNMANMLHYGKAILAAGFDGALFDYRGFGHSSDFPKNPAYLYYKDYVTDMVTAIEAAKRQFPENQLGIPASSACTILATLAVGSALLTVSFQSVRAALMNPVKSLGSG